MKSGIYRRQLLMDWESRRSMFEKHLFLESGISACGLRWLGEDGWRWSKLNKHPRGTHGLQTITCDVCRKKWMDVNGVNEESK